MRVGRISPDSALVNQTTAAAILRLQKRRSGQEQQQREGLGYFGEGGREAYRRELKQEHKDLLPSHITVQLAAGCLRRIFHKHQNNQD